jgi:WD40 repeat protein
MLFEYTFPEGKIGSVAVSPDNGYLAVGVFGKSIKIWSLGTKEVLYSAEDFGRISAPRNIGMRGLIVYCGQSQFAYATNNASIKVISLSVKNAAISCTSMETGNGFIKNKKHYVSGMAYSQSDNTLILSLAQHDYGAPPYLIKCSYPDMEVLAKTEVRKHFVRDMSVNQANNCIFILYEPTVEVRALDTLKPIDEYDPYQWFDSRYMLGNPAAVSKSGNSMVISNEGLFRYAAWRKECTK